MISFQKLACPRLHSPCDVISKCWNFFTLSKSRNTSSFLIILLSCTLCQTLILAKDGKGNRPDLIVYYGGDMTIIIHEGKKVKDLFLKDGTVPDPISTENSEFKIVKTIIKFQLKGGETDKWNKISNTCMKFSEDTSTVVNCMYTMDNTGNDHQK